MKRSRNSSSGKFTRKKVETTKSYSVTRYTELFKASHIWKIDGFSNVCPLENEKSLQSTSFGSQDCNGKFYIKLYPAEKGTDGTYHISLYLAREITNPVLIICEFSLIDCSGLKKNIFTFRETFENNTVPWGYKKFISRNDLLQRKDELLPDDQLVVSCVVTVVEKTEIFGECSSSEGPNSNGDGQQSISAVDWTAFLGGQPTDVVLRVGGEEISAHKSVLMCQSPLFGDIIEQCVMQGGDSEEITDAGIEIIVADIEMGVLQSLLMFMYTDKFSVDNVQSALKLLRTADKYDVPDLLRKCCDYLCGNVSEVNVFEILLVAEALDAEDVINACIAIVVSEMSSVTSLNDWIEKLRASPELLGVIEKHLPKDTFPYL